MYSAKEMWGLCDKVWETVVSIWWQVEWGSEMFPGFQVSECWWKSQIIKLCGWVSSLLHSVLPTYIILTSDFSLGLWQRNQLTVSVYNNCKSSNGFVYVRLLCGSLLMTQWCGSNSEKHYGKNMARSIISCNSLRIHCFIYKGGKKKALELYR